MKSSGYCKMIGKTIKSVVASESPGFNFPGNQVFLIFEDNTCMEVYGLAFTFSGGLWKDWDEDHAIAYAKGFNGRVRVYYDPDEPLGEEA